MQDLGVKKSMEKLPAWMNYVPQVLRGIVGSVFLTIMAYRLLGKSHKPTE